MAAIVRDLQGPLSLNELSERLREARRQDAVREEMARELRDPEKLKNAEITLICFNRLCSQHTISNPPMLNGTLIQKASTINDWLKGRCSSSNTNFFPGVQSLDLSNAKIDLIPKEFLSHFLLADLNLSHNELNYIDLSPYGSHRITCGKLNLSHNNIKKPKIDGSFQIIDLSYNQITEIDGLCGFNSLPELKILDLSHNKIENLPSAINKIGLKYIQKPGPFGTYWSKEGERSLIHLILNDNQLSDLPLSMDHLDTLTKLDLRNNRLKGRLHKIPTIFPKLTDRSNRYPTTLHCDLGGQKPAPLISSRLLFIIACQFVMIYGVAGQPHLGVITKGLLICILGGFIYYHINETGKQASKEYMSGTD